MEEHKTKSFRNLAIIGASGHGKVVEEIAQLSTRFESIILFDDDIEKQKTNPRVHGGLKEAINMVSTCELFVAIGNNHRRREVMNLLEEAGAILPVLIHPSAVISPSAAIKYGCVIMANAVINSSAVIEEGVIVNTGATIDHESHIRSYSHISVGSHVAGNVSIGEECWLGIGASVSNNINIGNHVVIGAGSVVIKDILKEGTYVGVPVRKLED